MRGALRALALAAAVGACASDSAEERVLSASDQYALGERLFEEGEYRDAIAALQTFAFNYPQDPRIADARWLTARAHYQIEDWPTTAQEFLNFQRDYPREERAAEALFLAGRAFQHMSLRPELDQRDTERAINVYDRLLREYPRSAFDEDARRRRSNLRDKLAEKDYLNGAFYFGNEDYAAAEIYLTEVIARFPDSAWAAPAYGLLARTHCERGRDDRAAEILRVLREQFPDSAAARDTAAEMAPRCRGEAAPGPGGG